ncbi:hypothetical protein Ddc_00889 [Ditylenchus destructor]|nr:hypothetical protein Ddc_00889 [Ditylenchus destructor]
METDTQMEEREAVSACAAASVVGLERALLRPLENHSKPQWFPSLMDPPKFLHRAQERGDTLRNQCICLVRHKLLVTRPMLCLFTKAAVSVLRPWALHKTAVGSALPPVFPMIIVSAATHNCFVC